jgi:hypothetical protein
MYISFSLLQRYSYVLESYVKKKGIVLGCVPGAVANPYHGGCCNQLSDTNRIQLLTSFRVLGGQSQTPKDTADVMYLSIFSELMEDTQSFRGFVNLIAIERNMDCGPVFSP